MIDIHRTVIRYSIEHSIPNVNKYVNNANFLVYGADLFDRRKN